MIFCFPVIYIGMCFPEDICSDALRRAGLGCDEHCHIAAQWIQGFAHLIASEVPGCWRCTSCDGAFRPPVSFVYPRVTYAFGDKRRERLLHYRNVRFYHQPPRISYLKSSLISRRTSTPIFSLICLMIPSIVFSSTIR